MIRDLKAFIQDEMKMDIRKTAISATVLFLVFFPVYFIIGASLAKSGTFSEYDILWQFDTPRIIVDMTQFIGGYHWRIVVHPLYLLMVNPLGVVLKHIFNSPIISSLILNSATGAFGVILAFVFLYVQRKHLLDSILFAFLFGLTTSHLLISSIPETQTLAVASLILAYILFGFSIKNKRIKLLIWVFVGVVTMGVTVTNFIQAFILYSIAEWNRLDRKINIKLFLTLGRYVSLVLVIVASLNFIQHLIYPTADLMFAPKEVGYGFEVEYFFSRILFREPLLTISKLLKNFFLVNFLAPAPVFFDATDLGGGIHYFPGVTFRNSLAFSIPGLAAILLGSSLLVGFLIRMGRKWIASIKERKISFSAIPFGFLACLIFNLALHSIYAINGILESGETEFLIYSGNFTFVSLALIFSTFNGSLKQIRIALIVLIILLGLNNLLVLNQVIQYYVHL